MSELERLVSAALWQQRMTGLYSLQLANCGDHVANQLRAFDRALADHATARAVKKREEMHGRAWLAGRDLGSAIRATLERADKEDREPELFRADMIRSPHRFSEHMEIRVHFHWRVRGRSLELWNDNLRQCRYVRRLYDTAKAQAERCPA